MTIPCFEMPHECTIQRVEYTETPFGGNKETRVTVATGVKCFAQNMKISERGRYSKSEMDVDTKIYFITEPNLRQKDYIVITKNKQGTSYVGQTFRFAAIDDSTAGHGIAWKAVCKRETNPTLPNPPA